MSKKGIIIGGGIGGISSFIALNKIGFDVKIYESAPTLDPIGAGIWMAPNAMQVFDRLGMADEIVGGGVTIDWVRVCDRNFKTIQEIDLSRAKKKYGFSITSIHRGTLQSILLKHVPSESFYKGKSLASFQQTNETITAKFKDSTEAVGDFLIGADGIHSQVRKQAFPERMLRYSGQTCWRGVADFELSRELQRSTQEIWGAQTYCGFSDIGNGKVYWYAVSRSPAGIIMDDPLPLKTNLCALFDSFPSLVNDLISKTDIQKIIKSDLNDLTPSRTWHQGSMCLIGDSAHPMNPNLGQGGAQAVEDAYFLAECLKRETSTEKAFQKFESIRHQKIKDAVNESYRFGKIAQIKRGATIRNLLLRWSPSWITQKMMDRYYTLDSVT